MNTNNPLLTLRKIPERLWALNVNRLPWYQAWPVMAARILLAVMRDLSDGQLNLRAMSLVYTTLLSLVPMLAISFSVLKGFGVHNQIEPLLLRLFDPLGDKAPEIAQLIIDFVDNIKVGVLGAVGLALLIYSVVSLMQKIEHAFNYTWHVTRERSFARRFSDYLSILLVGPLMIFSALGMAASVGSAPFLEKILGYQVVSGAFEQIAGILPTILIMLALAYIYMFMPNTRVKFSAALVGAVVAAAFWKITGLVFKSFIAGSANYAAVYSAFATLIVMLIWIYMTWLVLLLGASIAFYFQNPNQMMTRRGIIALSHRARQRLALMVMQLSARNFYDGATAWTADQIARSFHLPPQPVQDVIDALEDEGLLTCTASDPPGYQPGRPPETVSVRDIIIAVNTHGGEAPLERKIKAGPEIDAVFSSLDDALAKTGGKTTVRDLLEIEK